MSAQFKKTEAVIEAKHLADMGEEYYKAYVNKKVQDESDSNSVDLAFLKTQFMTYEKVVEIDSDSGSSFKIMPPIDIDISEDGDGFIIEYEIIGTVGTEEAVNNSKIKIDIW